MDLLSNLYLGLSIALQPHNLMFCFLGCLLGTLVGVLPGIGPTATIAMLLPITMGLDPATSLIMLAGIYYGAQYGGSTTAILINLPGESSSAVTAIDGYQMAKQGRAGIALATAALGSFFAGTVATVILALFAPPLAKAALNFGSPEYFSLMVLGLVCAIALAHGSILKATAMIIVGLLFGLVGADLYSGAQRFTFGIPQLSDELNFVAVAVGVFGIAEILRNLQNETDRDVMVKKVTNLWPSGEDFRRMFMPVVRGTALGSILGVLPASPWMPLMSVAMLSHGIVPGQNVVNQNPELFWGIIASMWAGNLTLVLLNLPLIGLWVRLLTLPYYLLFPAIMAFAAIGIYSINSNAYDLYSLALFGALGYALVRFGCEPAPLLLGFILGPMLEEHLRRAMIISRGDPSVFVTRPISATLLALSVIVLVIVLLPAVRRKREEVFVEEE